MNKQVKSSLDRSLNSNPENTYIKDARPSHQTHRLFIYCKCQSHSQAHQLRNKNSVQSIVSLSYFSGHSVPRSARTPALSSDSQIPPRHFQDLGGRDVWRECKLSWLPCPLCMVPPLLAQLSAGCHGWQGVGEAGSASVPTGLTEAPCYV